MILKLAMIGRLSFYFCGTVALSLKNTVRAPKEFNLDLLTDQEVFGLMRAVKTNVVAIVEGEEAFTSKYKEIEAKKKTKKVAVQEVVAVEEVQEEKTSEKEEIKATEEVVEVKEAVEVEATVEAKVEAKVEEPVVKKTATTRKAAK